DKLGGGLQGARPARPGPAALTGGGDGSRKAGVQPPPRGPDPQRPDRPPGTVEAVRRGRGLAAEAGGGGERTTRGRIAGIRSRVVGARCQPAPAEEVDRGGTCAARVPRRPREEGARRLGDPQHPVVARRRVAGAGEVRRGRAVAGPGGRGDEGPG